MSPRFEALMRCSMRFVAVRCGAIRRDISDILCAVRNSPFLVILITAAFLVTFLGAFASTARQVQTPAAQTEATPPPEQSPAETPAAPKPPTQTAPSGPVIVLDPAHGGTDTGARGENATEKDVVLQLARSVRAALERQGYRVVMTRNDDSNPSYDDRAAMANAYRDALFISLHASSTGSAGTVRAYYMQFSAPVSAAPVASAAPANSGSAKAAPPVALAAWEQAQRPYVTASHRLADIMQAELAQAFSGSPPNAAGVPVRALRSVTTPAVAVEISSVSTQTPDLLTASGEPFGGAISRAIAAFRQASGGGTR
jgi:N-acetylmuramoyl-L-alanine amidase